MPIDGDTISSTISSSVLFFSCLLSFPASGSFPMSQFLTSGVQNMKRQKQKGYGGKLDHIWIDHHMDLGLALPVHFVSSTYFSDWNFAFILNQWSKIGGPFYFLFSTWILRCDMAINSTPSAVLAHWSVLSSSSKTCALYCHQHGNGAIDVVERSRFPYPLGKFLIFSELWLSAQGAVIQQFTLLHGGFRWPSSPRIFCGSHISRRLLKFKK